MVEAAPTIKGIFVMSHVKALERQKGKKAVAELERCYGRPIRFKNWEDVPVREEVIIIRHALDILSPHPIPDEEREYEAGKLHFKNFSNTPLGKLVLPFLGNSFKLLMMNANSIASQVFRGVRFISEDLGERMMRVTMENNDYPIDHFRGFFQAWMENAGLHGTVDAEDIGDHRYAYTFVWIDDANAV